MSREAEHTIRLSEDEPEVGDRVSTSVSFVESDNEIADRLRAAGVNSGYGNSDLTKFVKKDKEYQRLCKLRTELVNEPRVTARALNQAEAEAKKAFRKWQLLRARNRLRKDEIQRVQGKMFQRMRELALMAATKSIRKIQAILGMQHLNPDKSTPEFHAKLSAHVASQATEIARLLAKPLGSPTPALTTESTETRN